MADINVVRAYTEVCAAQVKVSSAMQLLGEAAEAPAELEAALKAASRSIGAIVRDIGEFINAQNAPVAGGGPQ